MLAGNIIVLKDQVTNPMYFEGIEARDKVHKSIDTILPGILSFKGDSKYLVGDKVTWIDFFFYELVELMCFVKPDLFEKYSGL